MLTHNRPNIQSTLHISPGSHLSRIGNLTAHSDNPLIQNAAPRQIIRTLEGQTRDDLGWEKSSQTFDRFVAASAPNAADAIAVEGSHFNGSIKGGGGVGGCVRGGVGDGEAGKNGKEGE